MPTSQATMVLYGKTNPFNVEGFGENWYNLVMGILKRKWIESAHRYSVAERELSELIDKKHGLR